MALQEVGARLRLAGAPAFTRDAKGGANALDRLGRQAGQATREVSGLERAAKRSRSALGSIAKGAALGALGAGIAGVTGGVAFLAKGLQDASNLSETLSKSSTVFGKSADEVRAWAYDSTKNILMTREAAISGAATFGNLFTAMGVGQKPAADLSTSLVGLASDVASFNNVETDEALLALRAGVLGEAEPLRKFGVQLSAARIEAVALGMGMKKTGKDFTAAQKAQAAYTIIMEDTKKAQGDAARTQDGFANSTRKLRKNIADARGEIGMKLLPTAERLTKWANDVAVPALMKLADEFQKGEGRGGKFRDTLEGVGDKARGAVPYIKDAYDKTVAIVGWMRDHTGTVEVFAKGVGAYAVAMKAAAGATATMAGLKLAGLAFGIGAVGSASAGAAVGVSSLGGAAARFAGPIGLLVGALVALENLGVNMELGGKGTYDKIAKGLKNKDAGQVWDAVRGEGFIKDEWQKGGGSAPKLHPAVPLPGSSKGSPLGTRGPEGGRARGGPVAPGQAYRVGEYGPEVFVPRTAGRIVNRQQAPGSVLAPQPNINLHVEFNGYTGGPQDADRIVQVVRQGVRQELARR